MVSVEFGRKWLAGHIWDTCFIFLLSNIHILIPLALIFRFKQLVLSPFRPSLSTGNLIFPVGMLKVGWAQYP